MGNGGRGLARVFPHNVLCRPRARLLILPGSSAASRAQGCQHAGDILSLPPGWMRPRPYRPWAVNAQTVEEEKKKHLLPLNHCSLGTEAPSAAPVILTSTGAAGRG